MGSVGKAVTNAFSNPIRGLETVGTFGQSELLRNNAGPIGNMIATTPERQADQFVGTHYLPNVPSASTKGQPIYNVGLNPYGDAAQVQQLGQNDYNANNALIGQNLKTYQANQDAINATGAGDLAARAAARDQLSQLLQQQAQQTMKMTLPQTAEDYNSGGLLNSSGYGNEVARQEANLAAGISNQIAQQGLQDVNVGSQYRQQGLQNQLGASDYLRQMSAANQAGLNAMNQGALQRQFSVTDFGNAANTASIIGAQNAPNVGNGKSGTGSMLSGAGSLATGIGALK